MIGSIASLMPSSNYLRCQKNVHQLEHRELIVSDFRVILTTQGFVKKNSLMGAGTLVALGPAL
jgi:hypothetical protein